MIQWDKISLRDLAGFISEELRTRGIETILVGGACVTLYSKNKYQSYDLDFITYDEMKKVKKALSALGFVEKQKYFQHKGCQWFIEFVSPPVAIGNEPVNKFNTIHTKYGTIKLISAVDSVKDRLASFYYWNDKEAIEQAIFICLAQNINLKEVKRWSKQEGEIEKFNIFIEKLKKTISS